MKECALCHGGSQLAPRDHHSLTQTGGPELGREVIGYPVVPGNETGTRLPRLDQHKTATISRVQCEALHLRSRLAPGVPQARWPWCV